MPTDKALETTEAKEMISQSNLESFKREYVVVSHSDPDTSHMVSKTENGWWCSCKGFQYRGHCYHVFKKRLELALAQRDYFAIIKGLESHPRFSTFEAVMDSYTFGKDTEFDFLSCIALALAYENDITADHMHTATQDKFAHDKRIIGAVLGSLQKKGLLERIGYQKSTRQMCHNRPICLWSLTEKGRNLLKGDSIG